LINRQALLTDLQKLLARLEADLLERSESAEVPDVGQKLRAEYGRAKDAERTAQNYEDWRSDATTQAAAAWVLSCVFVRFLEDNRLIEPPKIAGPKERLQLARDEHELHFRAHPRETDRDYLLAVFDELAALPGAKDVFGEHNPVRELPNWLSGDAGGELLRFFQKIVADTGNLVHDFTDSDWDTRFLGDLYQDLSEAARKKYALLQTPEFVEEFILDRTLDPALDEFGLEAHAKAQRRQEDGDNSSALSAFAPLRETPFRMIDPACGSGHFLLGAFPRILDRWRKQEPGGKIQDLVQKTLDCIFGVDVNPFAVAIARFRLLLAAMRTCGVMKLAKSPAFHVNLACGDSLYHGRQRQQMLGDDWTDEAHYFAAEDAPALRQMLRDGTCHCVVGNPPYITPKDRAANEAYRKLYPKTCHMKYSLAAPFMERIFRLAVPGGFTGQITANSFMKREFGKKLIEEFLPQVDLTHVIDTSGAYIPGHGTPTVILFGRHRKPVTDTIRTVMGIRGEPSTPDDPSRGLVWSAVIKQIDQPGSQSEFVSVGDSPRQAFHKHPWSIGGGGAAELKEQIESGTPARLEDHVESIGFMAITGEDDVFVVPHDFCARFRLPSRPFVVGDMIRDWKIETDDAALFLYSDLDQSLASCSPETIPHAVRFLWPFRVTVRSRSMFGKTVEEHGFRWYEYMQFIRERVNAKYLIAFGEVATHNHFVLDRGGNVFNRTAPVIKLPAEATEDDHLALLGLLNSSTACFWLKQVCHNKGSTVDQHGARQRTDPFEDFYAFNATKLQQFPLPDARPLALASGLDRLAQQLQAVVPDAVLTPRRQGAKEQENSSPLCAFAPLREALSAAHDRYEQCLRQMIALQEELDWECYRLYGLTEENLTQRREDAKEDEDTSPLCAFAPLRELPPLRLGQRAFEIVMARKMAAGELQTTWFERHGSTPITEIPAEWPDDYRRLVERRIELIETDRNIALIEQPEYKRRWNTEPWESQLDRALREWLLDRLESYFDFDGRMSDNFTPRRKDAKEEEEQNSLRALAPLREISLTSTARLADVARQDAKFMQIGEVYRDDPAFDIERLVAELVEAESVPLLPVLRYKPSGLRKRQEWEKTWELQREEDRLTQRREDAKKNGEDLSAFAPLHEIPVPPKYTSADFVSTGGARYWALRGKLDVPKERWISFPHCEGPDGTLVIAWAGYDHLQLARSISAYYVDIQERLGGRDDPRLVPLLACVVELLPWLRQWHHDIDPAYNQRMDEVFEGFVAEEAKALGLTVDQVKAWQPPQRTGGRGRRRAET